MERHALRLGAPELLVDELRFCVRVEDGLPSHALSSDRLRPVASSGGIAERVDPANAGRRS